MHSRPFVEILRTCGSRLRERGRQLLRRPSLWSSSRLLGLLWRSRYFPNLVSSRGWRLLFYDSWDGAAVPPPTNPRRNSGTFEKCTNAKILPTTLKTFKGNFEETVPPHTCSTCFMPSKGLPWEVVSYTSFRRARNRRRSLVQSDDSHRRPVCCSTARVLSPGRDIQKRLACCDPKSTN